MRYELFFQTTCFELTPTTRSLFKSGKDSVVLYVSHGSAALRVYDRVGFAGLVKKDKPDGVEDALELGFTETDRGHW
jgi:hypothetical protein